MRTTYHTVGPSTYFLLVDLPPMYDQAALDLQFERTTDGFAKQYPTDTPHLAQIYTHFARTIETMILQKAGVQPAPWEQALRAFVQAIDGQSLTWWLRGSAALAIRGLPITPGDIDLTLDDAGAQQLGQILHGYLVEPVVPVHNWFCSWWGRAFWHTRIEWMGGVNESADTPEVGDFGPEAERRAEVVYWRGSAIRVPPLALQLQVTERRGLLERAELIRQAMRENRLGRHIRDHSGGELL